MTETGLDEAADRGVVTEVSFSVAFLFDSRKQRRLSAVPGPRPGRCVLFTVCFSGCSLVQNTYTNADKLLEAAEQLAQTGECDPEEIYQAAHQLEDRIQDFVRRVEQRKILLDMSVSFHTHVKEVRTWRGRRAWDLEGL